MIRKTVTKYMLQMEVLVDDASEEHLIQAARRLYSDRGGAQASSGKSMRNMSAEEFVDGIQNALLELVEGNRELRDAGAEVRAVRCSVGEPADAR